MADQRCGTCRWAEPAPAPCAAWVVKCLRPIPVCVVATTVMHPDDGTTCPCYQPAPQPQTETEDDGN